MVDSHTHSQTHMQPYIHIRIKLNCEFCIEDRSRFLKKDTLQFQHNPELYFFPTCNKLLSLLCHCHPRRTLMRRTEKIKRFSDSLTRQDQIIGKEKSGI